MVFLIVLGSVLLLIFLICLLPATVEAEYYGSLKYKIKIGFISLTGSNKKKKSEKSVKSEKKNKSPKNITETNKKKPRPDIKSIFDVLIHFLKNFKWKLNIKIKKLTVYIRCADADAAQTAILFGKVNAYAYTVDALIKSLFKVNETSINISVDYNESKCAFAGEINLFTRLGNIFLALIRFLVYLIVNKEKIKPILEYIKNKDGVNL